MTQSPRNLRAIAAGVMFAALSTTAVLAFSAPAVASTPGLLDPGTYTIRVDPTHEPYLPAAGQCLIQGNNGLGGPVRYMWGQGSNNMLCQWNSWNAFSDNGQGLFILKDAGFFGPEGEHAYVIVNKRSGQCLQFDPDSGRVTFSSQGCDPATASRSAIWWITGTGTWVFSPIKPFLSPGACLIFSNNGYDVAPSVYRWSESSSDVRWCGLGSEQALESTGQGLFMLVKVDD